MSQYSVEITRDNFEKEVIEASHRVPVVIDFWAPWCAPCRALKPILEKLAEAYQGRFVLAKLNTDELPELAQQFGIRGIPNVKAVINGQLAGEFTGAIPEAKVRAFIDQLLPGEAEQLRLKAQAAVRDGDFEKAESLLGDALAKEPGLAAARLDMAELLVARQAYSEADLQLDALAENARDGERYQALASKIAVWKSAQSLPSTADLLDALELAPNDHGLRLKLAERYTADGDFEAALETLMEVVERDRGPQREAARKAMVQVFTLAADQGDLVGAYRRRLATALN
ncbi:MAG TPA: tetratricopeptide repeat protein [Burkholderiales bacterium]|nr:tetratricopeptide repeat protein [Burkholderiales bacterium]